MKSVMRSSPSIRALLLIVALGTTAVSPLLLAQRAAAESQTAEDERNARFDKKNGVGTVVLNGQTLAGHGGGGPATTVTEIVASQNQSPMLDAQSDVALKTAQEKYASIVAEGGFPSISRGSYKNGSKGPAVAALNKHLFMEGYLRAEGTQGQFAEIYTNATEEAVSHYQRNMGLAVTGKVDGATLAELSVSADERLRAITANIPRLAIYEKDLGDRYLVVNVPAQQLETVSNGHVYSRHNVIVGRPERPTPVVMTPLATVKFNPYWNAPVSIVERDILPKMASGTQVLTDMNMKVFQGGPNGPEVDPRTVRFTPANIDKYLFRQEPGPHSAMATAKIEFMSTFGIYLHDTPEPELFKSAGRFFSSGCIRVEKMPMLVEWVLNGQGGFDAPKIASMAQTLERLDVPLATPPQLRVAYLTAWPAAGGTIAFRKDIYQMDSSGFTVGQPMPVGEKSPDGLRYVLKPLPRQISVDDAEAQNVGFFSIFGSRSRSATKSSADAPKKNVFGASLVSASSNAKHGLSKGGEPAGLFNWAAYHKEQAHPKKLAKLKKKKGIQSADAVPPDPTLPKAKVKSAKAQTAEAVPPDPTLTTFKKKSPAPKKLADCKTDAGKDCKLAATADKPPEKPAN